MIDNNDRQLVSICMVTYNHEKYIAQAIESVLMQKTNFSYELLIGDDFSTDRTREIIIGFQRKFSDRIKLIFHDKNLGPQKNFHETYHCCSGKYIALLEGDDYWTDPLKLQKQVDFLEYNPDFIICCHNSKVIYENNPEIVRNLRPDISSQKKEILTIEDQIKSVTSSISYHTSSVVFRNVLPKLPSFHLKVLSGDIVLFTLLSQFGNIRYLDEVMSVYRKNNGGITNNYNMASIFKTRIVMNNYLNEYFNYKYNILFKETNELLYKKLLMHYRNKKLYFQFIICKILIFINMNTIFNKWLKRPLQT